MVLFIVLNDFKFRYLPFMLFYLFQVGRSFPQLSLGSCHARLVCNHLGLDPDLDLKLTSTSTTI